MTPRVGSIIRVHEGVVLSGHRLGGQILTVVGTGTNERDDVDATEWTGDQPVHLALLEFDVIALGPAA